MLLHEISFITTISLLTMHFAMAGSAAAQYGDDDLKKSNVQKELFAWPDGIRGAVSLSFDDARPSQIDNGLPLFDRYGVRVTFFVKPVNVEPRLAGWKKAVRSGHEIGNHSRTHPCTGNFAFSRDNALENYSLDMMAADLDSANSEIEKLLDVKPTTFAYPCGQKYVGRGRDVRSYVPLVAERFVAGRQWLSEDSNDPLFCDMSQLLGMEMDGLTGKEMIALAQKAVNEGRWLVLCGHDIDKSGKQTTRMAALQAFCEYAGDPENGIWLETIDAIAGYIVEKREE